MATLWRLERRRRGTLRSANATPVYSRSRRDASGRIVSVTNTSYLSTMARIEPVLPSVKSRIAGSEGRFGLRTRARASCCVWRAWASLRGDFLEVALGSRTRVAGRYRGSGPTVIQYIVDWRCGATTPDPPLVHLDPIG